MSLSDSLTIVVDDTTDQALTLEHRECLESFTLAHPVCRLHVLLTGQKIVHLATGIVVGQLPPFVDRKEDAGMSEWRRSAKVRTEAYVTGEERFPGRSFVLSRPQRRACIALEISC